MSNFIEGTCDQCVSTFGTFIWQDRLVIVCHVVCASCGDHHAVTADYTNRDFTCANCADTLAGAK